MLTCASRKQEEIDYLKSIIEHGGGDHGHDGHNSTHKYEPNKRILSNPTPQRAFVPNVSVSGEAGRPSSGGAGGLPGVLGSLKSDPNGIVAGVVTGGVPGGRGRGIIPGTPVSTGPLTRASTVSSGGPPLRRAENRGVIVVGNGNASEGGEENSNIVIEEQDIVIASVNNSEK